MRRFLRAHHSIGAEDSIEALLLHVAKKIDAHENIIFRFDKFFELNYLTRGLYQLYSCAVILHV